MHRVTSLVTSMLVAAALLGLAGTTAAALTAISRANDRVVSTRELVSQFALLREALSEESFAEAGYRRSASDEAWQRVEEAVAAMPLLIQQVREEVPSSNGLALSQLSVLNARYVRQLRATRDTPATDGDDRVAGPALDAMRALLEATISRHRDAVTEATEQQSDLTRRLSVLLSSVFALAFGVLVWVFRLDRREQRRLRRESAAHRTRALTDPLTGLPNRAALLGTMEAELARADTQAALLFLDLDKFKPVNDTWGHHAGDALLQQVALRLQDAVREDDFAARLGGDEFAVFLPRGSGVEAVEARILAAFARPFEVAGQPFDLHTSIGMARSRGASQDPDELLRRADEALYRAKRARCP
ncbi:diguanylate cyclase domain-containing protein [Nocardioides sp. CPCC 206347]|uniref:diguanylate cyclase domain-containing protein n=1 Tax=Nocardioides sp. CPCC 206347 TaxID=3406463 RepID=UPI003B42FF97